MNEEKIIKQLSENSYKNWKINFKNKIRSNILGYSLLLTGAVLGSFHFNESRYSEKRGQNLFNEIVNSVEYESVKGERYKKLRFFGINKIRENSYLVDNFPEDSRSLRNLDKLVNEIEDRKFKPVNININDKGRVKIQETNYFFSKILPDTLIPLNEEFVYAPHLPFYYEGVFPIESILELNSEKQTIEERIGRVSDVLPLRSGMFYFVQGETAFRWNPELKEFEEGPRFEGRPPYLYKIEGTNKGILIENHRMGVSHKWRILNDLQGDIPSKKLENILKDNFISCNEDSRYLYSDGKIYISDEDGEIKMYSQGEEKLVRKGELIGSFEDFWVEKKRDSEGKEISFLIVQDQEEYEVYKEGNFYKSLPKSSSFLNLISDNFTDFFGIRNDGGNEYWKKEREPNVLKYLEGNKFKQDIKNKILGVKKSN